MFQADDWAVNAIGRNYSHAFGYGIMDASCMVRLAKEWKNVPQQIRSIRKADNLREVYVQGKSAKKVKTNSQATFKVFFD